MVTGPVLYSQEKNWFERLQSLEFLALVTAGAGSLGMNRPLIANGANLAYRKTVFKQVAGFTGLAQIASGDDDLLMHKIAAQTDWQIRFAADERAIIQTQPEPSLARFLNQRTRWASKATVYSNYWITAFLSLVYFFYLLLFPGIFLWGFELISIKIFGMGLLAKFIIDFAVVWHGCWMFKRPDLLKYFALTEILQIPYILYVGAKGTFGQFHWKERIMKRKVNPAP
jgi:cellulose synthase/poly-beta-1,6-N-acetylglucosamine synthase-like glycosyltransferase